MAFAEIVSGARQRWGLQEKLGEGDAGEVFLVESLLEHRQGILKRPRGSAFSSDIMRQAAQIKAEASILGDLAGALGSTVSEHVCVPGVLDQSPGGAELGDKVFIVLERAAGIDLRTISHWATRQPDGNAGLGVVYSRFAKHIQARGRVPAELMLRILEGVLDLFDVLHGANLATGDVMRFIWNDVKPEHLYWDIEREILTVIDWGNAQRLDADGASRDRRYSPANDLGQFVDVFARFLTEFTPGLVERLNWPEASPGPETFSEELVGLRHRIITECELSGTELRELRRQESDLLSLSAPYWNQIDELLSLQDRILTHGSAPNWKGAGVLFQRLAANLASDRDLQGAARVAESAVGVDFSRAEKWGLVKQVAELNECMNERATRYISQAAYDAIQDDWPGCLWNLVLAGCFEQSPDVWVKFTNQARIFALGLSADAITPYTAATRLYYTMQSVHIDEQAAEAAASESRRTAQDYSEEVISKWRQDDPVPPFASVGYSAVDWLLPRLQRLIPAGLVILEKALQQPRARVELFLTAWRERDFDAARKCLRWIFIWDPDRFRVFGADRMIRAAPNWLLRVRQGPDTAEAFPDYLTEIELKGREIRNLVGPATWLDTILEALKQLRSGERPVDLLMRFPELLNDMPWLSEYRSRETMRLAHQEPFSFERKPPAAVVIRLDGRDGKLGQDIHLDGPLDTWLAEARGSSARVFLGKFNDTPGDFAVKVMRPDRVEYSLPLFKEEAQILSLLRDVPGVTPLVEAGFCLLESGQNLPVEDRSQSAADLRGSLLRYGPEQVQNFLNVLDRQVGMKWVPYLVMGVRRHENNLVMICDAGHTHGWFLPLRESLFICIQICDILQIAHDRNIVYRDHKLLHYYWDPASTGVQMIDWNIARHHPQGLSTTEKQFDIVQFGARALHHIITGRPAPGALPLGPNRPEEIEGSADQYAVRWTYDDERLPNRIKDVIEATLMHEYRSFRDLRQDLYLIYTQLPE